MKLPFRSYTLCSLSLLFALPTSTSFAEPSLNEKKALVDNIMSTNFDPAFIDTTANPCEDFYQYACGAWNKQNPIPATRSEWGKAIELYEKNQKTLKEILENCANGKLDNKVKYASKLGTFYKTCMQEENAETASVKTISDELFYIDQIKDSETLAIAIARLHLKNINAFFLLESMPDFKNNSETIADLSQVFSLPEKGYYTKTDPKFSEIRSLYKNYIKTLFSLVKMDPLKAEEYADRVIKLETTLAQSAFSAVELRDTSKLYNRITREALSSKIDKFSWKSYFKALGYPDINAINISTPSYFNGLNDAISKIPLDDFKIYMKWLVLANSSGYASKSFYDARFEFVSKAFTGASEQIPRWERCISYTSNSLGEALGEAYVNKAFSKSSKSKAIDLISNLSKQFEKNLATLDWMDVDTKAKAKEKVSKLKYKIGYPDSWRNYDSLSVSNSSLLENVWNAMTFERKRRIDKVGKPLDRSEWYMNVFDVNAYYDPSINEMVFPAGILQPPFFSEKYSDVSNYAAIGSVMGHELGHGFDDEGRKFDANGNMVDWWSELSAKNYESKAQCVVEQYNKYKAYNDVYVNGELTLGENIADIAGLKLAYQALKAKMGDSFAKNKYSSYTADQAFFLSFTQGWCGNMREQMLLTMVSSDPHSPKRVRINGSVSNLAEFQSAFKCEKNSALVPQNRCSIW